MGLFLRTCHQISRLSPSARFRPHINYSSVWPAVPFRCLPSLPSPPAHAWKEPAGASRARSPPLALQLAPARQPLPRAPPAGTPGAGGGGAAGGAFPEGRGRAATCRRPPRGCAPLGWSPTAWLGARAGHRRRCKRPPAAGNEIHHHHHHHPRFGVKSRSLTLRLPRHER